MAVFVGVDCHFNIDGSVQVRRIFFEDRWQPVEQGRQWLDQLGRHVLVMLPAASPNANQVREILLRCTTLSWELVPHRASQSRLV